MLDIFQFIKEKFLKMQKPPVIISGGFEEKSV
jgi:hypothetical protein